MRHLFLALWLVLGLGFPSAGLAESAVILATTTSTQDTGLLDVLIPAFERSTGYTVKTIAVGTGAALAMGEKGDADVLLVHAPKAEEAYMADGRGLSRQLVMHNRFIIVGPAADPAQVHIASQKAAYTLTDDGTYLSQRATLDLVPALEDAKDLRNIYHVIVVKPIPGRPSNLAGGEAFAHYVVSADGQRLIAAYGKERFGRPFFTVDAGTVPVPGQ